MATTRGTFKKGYKRPKKWSAKAAKTRLARRKNQQRLWESVQV